MSLLEMNDDCLIEIFRRSSLEDLGIVWEICKRFQLLAVRAFTSAWKDVTITLRNFTAKDKLHALRILRQFGNKLQKVNIEFCIDGNEDFLNFIIDKCGLNLTEVKFSHYESDGRLDKFLNKKKHFSIQ